MGVSAYSSIRLIRLLVCHSETCVYVFASALHVLRLRLGTLLSELAPKRHRTKRESFEHAFLQYPFTSRFFFASVPFASS